MDNLIQDISTIAQTINRNRNKESIYSIKPKCFIEYKIEEQCYGYYNHLCTLSLFEKPNLDSKLLSLKEIINTFSFLEKDWDGYGGFAPSSIVVQNTKIFLELLPISLFKDFDVENIFPNPNGTISIEWRNRNNVVGVEIGNEYGVYFSLINSIFEKGGEKIQFLNSSVYSNLIKRIEKVRNA